MMNLDPALTTFLMRFGIDLLCAGVLTFGLFFPRYRDKELAITAMLFNVFIYSVLSVLGQVQFGVAAGFGLFAILAMFTVRSEPLRKIELTYLFGSVAIAVICSTVGTSMNMVVGMSLALVFAAWAIDHPKVLPRSDTVRITLDKIEHELLNDPEAMQRALSKRLGVTVLSHQITHLDYINDMAKLVVFFRKGEVKA